MNVPSIWSSFEVDCVCRDFSWEDYIDRHKEMGLKSGQLCKEAYAQLQEAVHTQMTHDFRQGAR